MYIVCRPLYFFKLIKSSIGLINPVNVFPAPVGANTTISEPCLIALNASIWC